MNINVKNIFEYIRISEYLSEVLSFLGQKSGFRPENPLFLVSELRPFSWGEPGRRAKKSSPTPLWGHRLPARGLDNELFVIYLMNIPPAVNRVPFIRPQG